MRRNSIATVVFLLLVWLFIYFFPTEKALPPSTSFIIKRAQEHIAEQTKKTPDEKLSYAIQILNTRLSEIEILIALGRYDEVIAGSSKYTAQANDVVLTAKENNLTRRYHEIHELFSRHRDILERSMPYNKEFEASWQSLLQASDTLTIYESELTP